MSSRRASVIIVALAVLAVIIGGAVVRASMGPGALTESSDDTRIPGAPVVAFYGDSYTLGTGASDPSKRWSSIIAAERGWNEVNPSVNGLGFVNNRDRLPEGGDLVDAVIASDPDILFVTMGLNDNFSMPEKSDEVHSAIVSDFAKLRSALPETRIIVVEPFWYTDERPQSLATISGWVAAEARVIGAEYIEGASHWIEGHPEWMADDGLHPNDEGYAQMARRMDDELNSRGL
ncbi:SGNH/GDSL hydrolase family protein [Agreia sp. VKM Ac-1783]|uniref:SGNH/GDSL hydrolase family protein n=1 Tax=Agreia sp. VKM Ac-1783 TaxID=1938889 RepID=UPI000A2AECD4|nr:SGNH/GDSL hydrolase family protein [Agreia sp. VKM Ac-1783]SMQ59818.1 Lysophospholipase L1 [Agreia sp. VKM Ac-1783]